MTFWKCAVQEPQRARHSRFPANEQGCNQDCWQQAGLSAYDLARVTHTLDDSPFVDGIASGSPARTGDVDWRRPQPQAVLPWACDSHAI